MHQNTGKPMYFQIFPGGGEHPPDPLAPPQGPFICSWNFAPLLLANPGHAPEINKLLCFNLFVIQQYIYFIFFYNISHYYDDYAIIVLFVLCYL